MANEKISVSVGLHWKRVLAVVLLIVYQVAGQIILSSVVVRQAEEQSVQRLQDAANEFKDNFYEHTMSDQEQLSVVADMLALLIKEGSHDMGVHLAGFEQRGMIDWLQILTPEGTLITGSSTKAMSPSFYQEELERLPYISRVSPGFVDPSMHVIRSAVPIISGNETIAILYGVYDLSTQHLFSATSAYAGNAYTFILEPDSGIYLFDSLRGQRYSGSSQTRYDPKPGFDMSVLEADLLAGREGYSAFRSKRIDDNMYLYYAPLGINNWMVMISVPEKIALSFAFQSRVLMIGSIGYISLGVLVYFVVLYFADQKLHDKNKFVNVIQSKLMEVYHQPGYFREAVLSLSQRARSEAVFLIDETLPVAEPVVGDNQALCDKWTASTKELNREILALCGQEKRAVSLHRGSRALRNLPQLQQIMKEMQLPSVMISPIISAEGTIHQAVGLLAPRNPNALVLLNALSVDLIMALGNIDYLTRMEKASTIDNLTGTMNRASYQMQLESLNENKPKHFSCVYVDVNDLHAINNRYGHEKGDEMLRFIADELVKVFGQRNVYRFGGDEFILLLSGLDQAALVTSLERATTAIEAGGYTVSVGYDWHEGPDDISSMIRRAEGLMYKAKYRHYQQKQKQMSVSAKPNRTVHRLLDNTKDINTFLQAAENHYYGVYFVDLDSDDVREVFARGYFYAYIEESDRLFSAAFHQYTADIVDKQSRRSVQNFFDYEQIGNQLAAGESPTLEYSKVDGERVRLTVYRTPEFTAEKRETLWVFESA